MGRVHSDRTTTAEEDTPSSTPRRAQPVLVLLFECDAPFRPSSRHLLGSTSTVLIGRGAERSWRRDGAELTLRVADDRVSSAHARLTRGPDGWTFEDLESKNGSALNGSRVTAALLRDGDVLECGRTFFLFAHRPFEIHDPPDASSSDLAPPAAPLLTLSASLERDLAKLAQVAPTAVPVCLRGDTGSGKGVVAATVHELSRRPGPLVGVNCGAIPDMLVEAELFGSRKGAFTGALENRVGLVRSAEHGTLLLDEIGDLPLASQAALLRVLQEKQVVPVGAERAVAVDFRLITSTHRDLDQGVREGWFREDLYARISGFSLTLPPLRERREDLGIFIRAILGREAGGGAVKLHPEAARALVRHSWPLNVRELEKCLVTATVLARGGTLVPDHLPEPVTRPREPAAARRATLSDEDQRLRGRLEELLAEHGGNISAVARAMQRQRVQIHRWLRRFGLDLAAYRRDPPAEP